MLGDRAQSSYWATHPNAGKRIGAARADVLCAPSMDSKTINEQWGIRLRRRPDSAAHPRRATSQHYVIDIDKMWLAALVRIGAATPCDAAVAKLAHTSDRDSSVLPAPGHDMHSLTLPAAWRHESDPTIWRATVAAQWFGSLHDALDRANDGKRSMEAGRRFLRRRTAHYLDPDLVCFIQQLDRTISFGFCSAEHVCMHCGGAPDRERDGPSDLMHCIPFTHQAEPRCPWYLAEVY